MCQVIAKQNFDCVKQLVGQNPVPFLFVAFKSKEINLRRAGQQAVFVGKWHGYFEFSNRANS